MQRQFVRRSPAEIREAAARLCERDARTCKDTLWLEQIAKRIRRIPLAGCFKVLPKKGM